MFLNICIFTMKHDGSVVSLWKEDVRSYLDSYKNKLIQQTNILQRKIAELIITISKKTTKKYTLVTFERCITALTYWL
jgi:hypothetical protein